jgi:hypothetical protein
MANLTKAESNLAKLSERRERMETELVRVADELAALEGLSGAEGILAGIDLDRLEVEISALVVKKKALTNAISLAKEHESKAEGALLDYPDKSR